MVKINMNQQRRLSRHNSRQSSIGETASVCSTKSAKSTGSADTNGIQQSSANNNSKKSSNGLGSKHGSQESQLASNANGGCSGQGAQANILNVAEMLLHGVADNEILDIWLKSIQCEEFVSKFIDAGYDMPTLSRITPQDLTAIGVTDPTKRLKILTEIKKLNLQDGIPNFLPASLSHWLSLLRLDSYYYESLCDQKVDTMEKMCQLTWEDFEELGITKLGHQKRFQLAIERVKELEEADSKTSTSKTLSEPIYDTNPSQILLVASTENHSMNGPIINKQSNTSEISSTGSGSMHSVYSAASVQYQPTYAPLPDNNQHQQQQQSQHQQSMIVSKQLTPNGTQTHNQPQQQQANYGQLPPPIIYQQPAAQTVMQQPPLPPPQQQQSHYLQRRPIQQQSLPMQPSQTQYGLNNDVGPVGNGVAAGQQHNRQSIGQLPFAALAKLPKHQQLLLQQSSIYATLSRQPFRAKQPPPVPIRTNSLKSNSLVDDAADRHQSQQLQHQSGYQKSQLNHCHHTNSTSSLYRSDTVSLSHGPGQAGNRSQFNSNTMLTKNKSFSGNAHMEASRQRFLNRISQQPQPTVHQQLSHQLSQQFQNLTNQNICTSSNNGGSSNQNLIYGLHGSSNGIVSGARALNSNPLENDSNLFRPLPNSYIGVNNINQQHPYHHQTEQQNAPPISAASGNNDNHRDTTPLYHTDDFDLHSDTNSTKSLIMQSSTSLVASPVNQNSSGIGIGNQKALCSLSQGSGSSQTLYNSASSGGSNDQSLNAFNIPQSGDMMQRSAAVSASSCTLSDANLSMSNARQQQRQPPDACTVGAGSITANSSAANLPSLAHSVTSAIRPTSTASANNTNASHCNATTGKDDDFPPPPSPLSLTDLDEHDLVSLNSADISHGLMTFRVGI